MMPLSAPQVSEAERPFNLPGHARPVSSHLGSNYGQILTRKAQYCDFVRAHANVNRWSNAALGERSVPTPETRRPIPLIP